MSWKYYTMNFMWGLLIFIFIFSDNEGGKYLNLTILPAGVLFTLNLIFFPFSKRATEVIALKVTKKEFWSRGFFIESASKSGLYALHYLFCFFASIPIGMPYFIYIILKKRSH